MLWSIVATGPDNKNAVAVVSINARPLPANRLGSMSNVAQRHLLDTIPPIIIVIPVAPPMPPPIICLQIDIIYKEI